LIKKTNSNVLLKLKSELADAAQKIYDEWEQDENGYCEMIG